MGMDTFVLALALAIGPAAAALVVLWRQERDRRYRRRLELFTTMVRTRRLWLNKDWIGALNLTPIEFDRYPLVLEAWNAVLDKFADPAWRGSEQQRQRVVLDTEAAVCALLQHMAEALGIDLQAQFLRSRNYAPLGWLTDELQERHERELVLQILQGARPLRVDLAANGERAAPVQAPVANQLPPI